MKWVLVGPRGSGKTTVGKLLSAQWQIALCDLDDWITERSGKSPNQWIEEDQESTFRQWEANLLKEWYEKPEAGILATGGGTVVQKESQNLLATFTPVVWLKKSVKSRVEVQKKDPRARLTEGTLKKEIEELDAIRGPIYERVSDHSINTDLSYDDVLKAFEQLRRSLI